MPRKKDPENGNGTTTALRRKRAKLRTGDGTGKNPPTAEEVIAAAQAATTTEPTTTAPAAPAPQQNSAQKEMDAAMERIKKVVQRAREIKDIAERFDIMSKLTTAVMGVKDWESLPVAVAKGDISDKEVPGTIIMINEAILCLDRVITEVHVARLSWSRKRLEDGIRVIDNNWKGPKADVNLTVAHELLDQSAKAIKTKRLPKGIGREVDNEADRLWEEIASYCRTCGTGLPDYYVEKGGQACKACNDAFLKKQKETAQQAQAARDAAAKSMKDRIRAAVRKP